MRVYKLNFKKILAIVMVCVFAFSGIGMAKAKVGGGGMKAPTTTSKSLAPSTQSKSAAPSSEAPKTNAADTNRSNATTNSNTANTNTTNNAATNNAATTNRTNAANQATQQQSGSRWGSALRNIGLFAGGMMLGSMLSSMFGMGGFMGDVLGLIANVVLIGIVVMIIMAVFRKFFGKKNEGNAYASSQYTENNIRCANCGWVSPDRNNPPKFCPECGSRMNGNDNFHQNNYSEYNQYHNEQDAQYQEPSSRRIIDITPPKDKDKF